MNPEHVISDRALDKIQMALDNNANWIAYNSLHYFLSAETLHAFRSAEQAGAFALRNNSSSEQYTIIRVCSLRHLFQQIGYGNRLEKIIHQSKNNFMNAENYQYLKDNVKYLGFGESLDEVLKVKLSEGAQEFSITHRTEMGRKQFEAALHFKRSEASDLYFLNSYSASLQRSNREQVGQTFYLYKGKGVTAREAFNLLEGRAVYKELYNKEGEAYKAWLQIDFSVTDKRGNYELKQFHDNYGFDLKEAVSKFAVSELKDPEKEKQLLHSLQKGNIQSVTIATEVSAGKMFLEANPQYKTVNLYDADLKRVQRENIALYLSAPGQHKTIKEKQGQEQDATARAKKGRKNGMEVEGAVKTSPKKAH